MISCGFMIYQCTLDVDVHKKCTLDSFYVDRKCLTGNCHLVQGGIFSITWHKSYHRCNFFFSWWKIGGLGRSLWEITVDQKEAELGQGQQRWGQRTGTGDKRRENIQRSLRGQVALSVRTSTGAQLLSVFPKRLCTWDFSWETAQLSCAAARK